VLVFGCWLLAHLTGDLSQAKKKNVLINLAADKMTIIFTQNDNFGNFAFAQLETASVFFSS
jgi:hypothetical protein